MGYVSNPQSFQTRKQQEPTSEYEDLRPAPRQQTEEDTHREDHTDEQDSAKDEESLDGLNIDKEEDIQQLLRELNDTAIQALKTEDNDNALECLKRGEQLLEAVTAEGKDVDRNLIIVILYNLACCYQRLSMLEDCASYLDGTIYNLNSKVTNFTDNADLISMLVTSPGNSIMSGTPSLNGNEAARKFNISAKLFKLRYLCKCHLQLCAVLSQLNKHQEALIQGQIAAYYCQELIKNTHQLCKSYIQKIVTDKQKSIVNEDEFDDAHIFGRRTSYYVEENDRILNLLTTNCEPILQTLADQINHFNKYNKIEKAKAETIEDQSILDDVSNTVMTFNPQKLLEHAETNQMKAQKRSNQNSFTQKQTAIPTSMVTETAPGAKKAQLNESTYYNTKGGDEISQYSKLQANVKTILGVREQDDWIFNLNIGNVMHLLPMNLEELNLHVDNSHEISRDAMLEKIILLSVSYFCVGTELRFLSQPKEESKKGPAQKPLYVKADSEMWHAKALETSCTFLPSECPLVSHIIMSYQKHHSPALQTIPEDEPLVEDLKVIRPLNEIKNDTVNYHQIIRTYIVDEPVKAKQHVRAVETPPMYPRTKPPNSGKKKIQIDTESPARSKRSPGGQRPMSATGSQFNGTQDITHTRPKTSQAKKSLGLSQKLLQQLAKNPMPPSQGTHNSARVPSANGSRLSSGKPKTAKKTQSILSSPKQGRPSSKQSDSRSTSQAKKPVAMKAKSPTNAMGRLPSNIMLSKSVNTMMYQFSSTPKGTTGVTLPGQKKTSVVMTHQLLAQKKAGPSGVSYKPSTGKVRTGIKLNS